MASNWDAKAKMRSVVCAGWLSSVVRQYSQAVNRLNGVVLNIEQVYYVLENRGVLQSSGEGQEIAGGDMIHLPVSMIYKVLNPYREWLSYLIMAG